MKGYKKINIFAHADGHRIIQQSGKCFSGKHTECDGYVPFFPRKEINKCHCNCHRE